LATLYHRWIQWNTKGTFRNRLSMLLKLVVLVASVYYLLDRLTNEELSKVQNLVHTQPAKFIGFLGLVILLSILNLILDTSLWAAISGGLNPKRWLHYLKHHLISLSIGSVTPVSLGEYGGKVRQFSGKINKLKGLYLAYLFRISKMISRNFVGSVMLYLLIVNHAYQNWPQWIALLIGLGCVAFMMGFLYIEKILPFVTRLPLFGRAYLKPLSRVNFSKKEKSFWLLLGALKFLTYSLQLALMLYFFAGSDFTLMYLLLLAGIYYSVASYIPSIQIVDPLIKATAGILILQGVVPFAPAIALSITLVWLVNVGLPSLGGLALWMRKGERSA